MSISYDIADEQLVSDSVHVLHDAFTSVYGETYDDVTDINLNYLEVSNTPSSVSFQEITYNSDNVSRLLSQDDSMNSIADPQNVVIDTYTENINDLLTMLQQADEGRKAIWLNMSTSDFKAMMKNKETECKTLLKREIIVCLNFVKS